MRIIFFVLFIISIFSLILIAGCNQDDPTITYIECNKDSDCGVGGCSGQICGGLDTINNIITTCEFRPEYECLKLTSCQCINNRCNWEENNQYKECVTSPKN